METNSQARISVLGRDSQELPPGKDSPQEKLSEKFP